MFTVNKTVNSAGLLALVIAAIGLDNYAHGATASRVVSVRAAFRRLLGRVRSAYNTGKKKENPNHKNVGMPEILKMLANKTLGVDFNILIDFGRDLAQATGCTTQPTEEEIVSAIAPLAEDFTKNNEYVAWDDIKEKDILEIVQDLAATAVNES